MPRAKLIDDRPGLRRVAFICPGCDIVHAIDPDRWVWNGDLELPTFSPSVLVQRTVGNMKFADDPDFEEHDEVCHSFVTMGLIQFLDDCTHEQAGNVVALPEWQP